LKKTPGGANADMSEIRKWATENKDIIKNQISEIDPDIIIACGKGSGKTAYILSDILGNELRRCRQ